MAWQPSSHPADGITDGAVINTDKSIMKGDREKCIQAGASDYIPKPVDNEQSLSLLRVWLYK